MLRSRVLILCSSFLLTFVMALVSSCTDDLPEIPQVDNELTEVDYITVKIKCGEAETRTSVTENGVETLNENLIKSVTLCLWPNGGDWLTDQVPKYIETFSDINAQGEAIVRLPLTTDLISHLFNQDNTNTCQAFVAVNIEPGTANTVDALRALAISSEFPSEQVQKSFAMDGDGTVKLNVLPDGNMYASGTINVRRSAAKIDLHLNVKPQIMETMADGTERTWSPDYSRMRIFLKKGVKDSTLDPDPSQVSESAYYGTPDSFIYGFKLTTQEVPGDAAHKNEFPYEQEIPFYSYPNKWNPSDEEDAGRSFMLLTIPWSYDGVNYKDCYYRVLIVDPSIAELVRNTSYHVMLNVGVLGSFVPDDPMPVDDLSYICSPWGEETIDVNITEPRYLVVNQNNFEINNQEEIIIPFYTSHNTVVTSATMTFTRFNFSDEGTAFDVTVDQNKNNLSKTRTGEYVFECDFNMTDTTLVVKHPLKVFTPMKGSGQGTEVDLTKNVNGVREKTQTTAKVNAVLNTIEWYKKTDVDEYSKVVFTVTVQHKDMKDQGKDTFKETVTITQYPGMYIEALENYVKKDATSFDYSGIAGSTYINGNNEAISITYSQPAGNAKNGYMTSIGLSTGNLNWNPNLYLVTITRLPNEKPYKDYIISDPRWTKVNNNLDNTSVANYTKKATAWGNFTAGGQSQAGCIKAKATYMDPETSDNTRTLTYYYPTFESDDYKNVVSPKFRICSSYAGTGDILTRMLARRRAASFQEMGYPAGRWRLPTYAEVEYVMKLAADNKIPRLFGRNDATPWIYWCAQGAVSVPGKTAASTAPSLVSKDNDSPERSRFVYDEWYWGSKILKENGKSAPANSRWDFTWGDEPR